MASNIITHWLDCSTPQTVGILLAIVRHFDNALGYPIVSTYQDGTIAPAVFDTLHHTFPRPHPTVSGRYALPLSAVAFAVWSQIVSVASAKVAASADPTGLYAAILAVPAAITNLDATWSPASIVTTSANPSIPPDTFAGVTP